MCKNDYCSFKKRKKKVNNKLLFDILFHIW